MVIIPSQKKVFIHIPRTSGSSLSAAICEAIPGSQKKYGHMTYREAVKQYPGHEFFTIMRNPWDWFRSLYLWQFVAIRPDVQWSLTEDQLRWALCVTAGSFDDFIADCYQKSDAWLPGIWARYIASFDVKVFQYAREGHSQFSGYLGVELPEKRVGLPDRDMPPFSAQTVAMIHQLCADDVNRFGYQAPDIE